MAEKTIHDLAEFRHAIETAENGDLLTIKGSINSVVLLVRGGRCEPVPAKIKTVKVPNPVNVQLVTAARAVLAHRASIAEAEAAGVDIIDHDEWDALAAAVEAADHG